MVTTKFREADITINDVKLTLAQTMVIRVALEHFTSSLANEGLGDDAVGRHICLNYLARLDEIRQILYERVS